MPTRNPPPRVSAQNVPMTPFRNYQPPRGSVAGVVATATPRDDPLENHYVDPRRGIGSDYGEGFLQGTFGSSGEFSELDLDVDTMNDRLKVTGAERHRQSQFPDEALGLIFDLSVFVDVESKQRDAWDRVADSHGYRRFDFAGRPASHVRDMMAERLILHVFKWDFGYQGGSGTGIRPPRAAGWTAVRTERAPGSQRAEMARCRLQTEDSVRDRVCI